MSQKDEIQISEKIGGTKTRNIPAGALLADRQGRQLLGALDL